MMIRKLSALLLCLLVFSGSCLTVFAASANVIDQAGLLSSSDVAVLEEEAVKMKDQYGLDLVYLTVESLNGKTARDYADDYYDQNGYGEDGVLFLLAMEEREWYISTCGIAIYALTDYALGEIESEVVPYLSDGRYYEAFYHFQVLLSEYMDAYEQGEPIDGYVPGYREDVVYYEPEREVKREVNLLLSLVIGVVVAAVAVLIMRSSMNTKRKQSSAGDYLKQGSYHLRRHQDLFLYSNVTKTRRQENNGTRGGGSSVHRSSGGRSHGGRGGRF